MISKITTISLLIVFIGCSSIKEISSTSITSSKYETVDDGGSAEKPTFLYA